MQTINCPSCAGQVQIRIQHCKLISCDYCGSPLLLEDDSVKNIGEQSSLAEIPSILKLGHNFQYQQDQFMPQGRVQYDYGDGVWEEWWVVTNKQRGLWISIDEGEIAMQTTIELTANDRVKLPNFKHLSIGQAIDIFRRSYKVTEKNSASCLGIEGQLPKVILAGEAMDYIDLSSAKGKLISVEYDKNGLNLFKGSWIDPFELKAL